MQLDILLNNILALTNYENDAYLMHVFRHIILSNSDPIHFSSSVPFLISESTKFNALNEEFASLSLLMVQSDAAPL